MVHGDEQTSEAELAACNGSMDIARIHTGLTPPPLHRLAA
jgi:hypothetical protein